MNITVIGGKGFIGSNLCESLVENKHNVTVFDRPNTESKCTQKTKEKINWFDGDFQDNESVASAVSDANVVIHLVSTTLPESSNRDPVFDLQTNVVPTIKLLEAATRYDVEKVIFVSSGGTVYGIPKVIPTPEIHQTEPICAYGISKLMIEKYLSLFKRMGGPDFSILRFSNPYGRFQNPFSNQGLITVFLQKVLNGEAIEIWGDGTVIRDYLYISDGVEAILRMLTYQGNEKVFNVGSGCGNSINEVIEVAETILDSPIKRVYRNARDLDVPTSILDVSRLKNETGWTPKVDLAEGIRCTLNYLRETQY